MDKNRIIVYVFESQGRTKYKDIKPGSLVNVFCKFSCIFFRFFLIRLFYYYYVSFIYFQLEPDRTVTKNKKTKTDKNIYKTRNSSDVSWIIGNYYYDSEYILCWYWYMIPSNDHSMRRPRNRDLNDDVCIWYNHITWIYGKVWRGVRWTDRYTPTHTYIHFSRLFFKNLSKRFDIN